MRETVQKLTVQLVAQRKEYSAAMRNLEQISEGIHRHRSFSLQQGGVKAKYQDEVSALEAQAGLAGLNITEDPRASDEHIHYRPDDVDSASHASETSSIQMDDASQESEDVGDCSVHSFEYNGEVEDNFTVERHGQSPLVNSTSAQADRPHQAVANGERLEALPEDTAVCEAPAEITADGEIPGQSTADREASPEIALEHEVPPEIVPEHEVPPEIVPERKVSSEFIADGEVPTEIPLEDTVADASTDTLTEVSKEDPPSDKEYTAESTVT